MSAQIQTETDAIVTQLGTANATIKPQMDTLASTLTQVDLTPLTEQKDIFTGVMEGMLGSIQTMAPQISEQMTTMFDSITGTGDGGAMLTAVADTQATFDGILAIVTTTTAAINLAVLTSWTQMQTDILATNTTIVTEITTSMTSITTTTTNANAAIVMNMTATWAAVVAAVLNAGFPEAVANVCAQALASAMTTAASFTSVGLAMMQGLASGIYAGQSMAINAAVSAAVSAYSAAKAALVIGSPSKKFEELGKFSMIGLARGILKNASDPMQAIKGVAGNLVNNWGKTGLKVNGATVNQRVDHVIRTNLAEAKPAVINLAMGNQTYSAYVEDITGRQSHTAKLERRYLR